MRAALEEGAAALYRYRTPEQATAAFDRAEQALDHELTSVEFWSIMAPLAAYFTDAHLSVLPSRSITDAVTGTPSLFPLRVRLFDERMLVFQNPFADGPPNGSEILSINNRSAAAWIDACRSLIPHDGDATIRSLRRLEREFNYWCVPVMGFPQEYRLEYRSPDRDSAATSTTVRGVDTATWNRAISAKYPAAGAAPYNLELRDDKVAVFTLRSFTKGDGFNPAKAFADVFARIRDAGVEDLILDVRSNGGGRDGYGALLFSYLAADTFTYAGARVLNKKRFAFIGQTDDWMLNWMSYFISKKKTSDGRWALNRDLDRSQKPATNPYLGRVFLLVDGRTFSTASEFVSVARYYRRATIVGEETGTAYGGGSGAAVSLVLRNTGLIVNVPIIAYFLPSARDPDASRGVLPDIDVHPTITDLLAGRDPVRDTALAVIRRRQGR